MICFGNVAGTKMRIAVTSCVYQPFYYKLQHLFYSMRYYIIAGEASGDLHGSNLITAIRQVDNNVAVRCWGGDKMEKAGATLVKHYRDLAFMGFVEVVKNLPAIFNNLSFCKTDIESFHPDVVVLIDYPGFNLRTAKWAKRKGFKVVYYISPQVWAWKENRVRNIRRYVDKMLVILPFEKAFYQKWNYEVDYVGHPLVEVIEQFKPGNVLFPNQQVIALLPGSRKQEIQVKLPIMLLAAKHFPEYRFVVARAPGLDEDFYNSFMQAYPNVSSVIHQTYQLLSESCAALVTSGTATLETALFNVPEVICYKGGAISYHIAKMLVKIKFIGLVNLIAGKAVVRELIQGELTETNIVSELQHILHNQDKRNQIFRDYAQIRNELQQGGNASANAAQIIYTFITKKVL
jgi:lipid-A-disaccharide synthase